MMPQEIKMSRATLVFLGLIAVFLLFWVFLPREHTWKGYTMGTTYQITVSKPFLISRRLEAIQDLVQNQLEAINHTFSQFEPQSELMLLNQLTANVIVVVSPEMFEVLKLSKKIYASSGGAFDPTVYPLIKLWGFGELKNAKIPSADVIDAALEKVGFDHFQLIPPNRVRKSRTTSRIDLSAVAKGYAVDRIARFLPKFGFRNFVINIGGEIYVAGTRQFRRKWRIGINVPNPEAGPEDVFRSFSLRNKGVATSGDYRNFRQANGQRYQHIIDPSSGRPVTNNLASVTVIADSCAYADGLATAAMVLGVDKSKDIFRHLRGVEAFFIVHQGDELTVDQTRGFPVP